MRGRAAQVAIALAVSATVASTGGIPVNAAGSTYIDVSNSNPKAGDLITVRVRASESDTLTLTYDNTLLDPQQINAAGYSRAGNKISFNGISGTITFRAVDQGAAGLKVTAADPSLAACSMFVHVTAKKQEDKSQENTRQQEAQTQQSEPDLNYNGKNYTISEKFQGQTLPFGFSQTRQTINNYNYKVLTNPTLQMTLVYLKESDKLNEDGHFFIYHQDGTVEPFYQLGDANQYLVLTATEGVSGLTSATLTLNGITYPTYTDASGNIYAYGKDQTGNSSWFRLDPGNGSFSAVADINSAIKPAAQEEEAPKTEETAAAKDTLADRIRALPLAAKIAGPLVLLLLLLASLLTALRHKKKESETVPAENAATRSEGGEGAKNESVLAQDTLVYEPAEEGAEDPDSTEDPSGAVSEEKAASKSDDGRYDASQTEIEPDNNSQRESGDASQTETAIDGGNQAETKQDINSGEAENLKEAGPGPDATDQKLSEEASESALFARVEQERKDRLAKISARFGNDMDIEEEDDAANEPEEQAKDPLDIGDTTNLDPGSISVAAENKGSNDGVLEAVEAAVAYARRKAEQQAKEEAASRDEKEESLPELQLMDLNDL